MGKGFYDKRLGQHFLIDPVVKKGILALCEGFIPKRAKLYEIGPGLGALTYLLMNQWPDLSLIELDKRFIDHWAREQAKAFPELIVIHADASTYSFLEEPKSADRPIFLVGNLPYNIVASLLPKLLVRPTPFAGLLFMVQKEVGLQLTASTDARGEGHRGRLSLLAEFFCQKREFCFSISPKAFHPKPKVDSAMVRLTPRAPAPSLVIWGKIEALARKLFQFKRKSLRASLSRSFPTLTGDDLETLFGCLSVSALERVESLSVQHFQALISFLEARCPEYKLRLDRK